MTLALCCGVTGNVIWGASYLFTRIAQQEAPPMVQMSLRFLLAFLLLNLMMLFGWEKIRLRGEKSAAAHRALLRGAHLLLL